MPPVGIMIHSVRGKTENVRFPEDAIREAYRTAGIELNFSRGRSIETGETLSLEVLVEDWSATSDSVGHVIVGTLYKGPRTEWKEIAGQLVDRQRRGVAIVYSASPHFRFGFDAKFLQTAIHEIGHMLNLGHQDGVTPFVSAMNQAKKRAGPTRIAWDSIVAEAADLVKKNQDPYFSPPVRNLACFPFALEDRRQLNRQPASDLAPWGGAFRPLRYTGADDTA